MDTVSCSEMGAGADLEQKGSSLHSLLGQLSSFFTTIFEMFSLRTRNGPWEAGKFQGCLKHSSLQNEHEQPCGVNDLILCQTVSLMLQESCDN